MTHIKNTNPILPLAVLYIIVMFQACKQQPDYKAIRQQVVSVHDSIMSEDGKLMADQSMLKSMITPVSLAELKKDNNITDTAAEKMRAMALIHRLDSISNAMSDWMSRFNPDVQGKNAQQATEYFSAEKIKVSRLDSSYKALLKISTDYLKQFHLKPAKSAPMKMKM